jgi:hypothetical protein
VTLFGWIKGLCRHNKIKALVVRSSWIIQMVSTSKDECPYEEEEKEKNQRRRHCEGREEIGVMIPQAKNGCWKSRQAGKKIWNGLPSCL